MDDRYNIPGLLGAESSPSFLQDIISRLQLSANIESEKQGGINSVYGGGRVGYGFPIDNNLLSLGLLGSGYKVSGNTPEGSFKESDIGLRGGDVSYMYGPNEIGASYEKQPNIGDIINLFYRRSF